MRHLLYFYKFASVNFNFSLVLLIFTQSLDRIANSCKEKSLQSFFKESVLKKYSSLSFLLKLFISTLLIKIVNAGEKYTMINRVIYKHFITKHVKMSSITVNSGYCFQLFQDGGCYARVWLLAVTGGAASASAASASRFSLRYFPENKK